MRTTALLALLSLSSCSIAVRAFVDRCEDGTAVQCDGNVLVSCQEGLVVRQDCGALICNDTLEECSSCGNSNVDDGEECDDGNQANGDACENDCTLPFCGNNIIDIGEECDNGGANSDTVPNACRTNCDAASCGDSVIDAGEECDDGPDNADESFACRESCDLPACGDGIVDFQDINGNNQFDIGEGEQCDDLNSQDDDGCESSSIEVNDCLATFPGCNNGNAREVNAVGDHELCFDRPQTVHSLGAGSGVNSVVAVDLNGDFKSDAAVVEGNQDLVTIFRNQGNLAGDLIPPGAGQNFSISPGIDPTAVVSIDINGDFKRDLITTNQGSNNISVLLNTTLFDGQNNLITFSAAQTFAAGNGPVALVAGDLNKDGFVDIAVTNQGADAVNVLLGNGNGTFQAPRQQAAGDKPVAIAIADVNEDTNNDLVVANELSDNITILEGNGDTANLVFQSRVQSVGDAPLGIDAGDIDADNDEDVVVTLSGENQVGILRNDGAGNFIIQKLQVQNKPDGIILGDINHDDQGTDPFLLEIIVTNQDSDTISILRAKEVNSEYAPQLVIRVGNAPVSVSVNDFDINTYFDIVVANNQDNSLSVLYFTP